MSIGTVALVPAYEIAPDADGLPVAARPFAGATVLEHQARRAVRAGAERLIVLAEGAHPALTAVVQRLRRDGLPTDLVTSLSGAADLIHPSGQVLVIADACLPAEADLERVTAGTAPVLLTVADLPGRDLFERIDASQRWAGVALTDGLTVADTAPMVGEWDPPSVLLRRLVQSGAARLAVDERGEDSLPILAHAVQGLAGIERRLVAGTRGLGRDWPGRLVFPLAEEAALPPLFRRQIDPWWLMVAAAALAVLAGAVSALAPRASLVLLLLSGPICSTAARLALIRAAEIRRQRLFDWIRTIGATATLAGVASLVAAGGQWGWWLVAAAVPACMAAFAVERRTLRRLTPDADAPWLASLDAFCWTAIPFGVVGEWGAALAVLALYAAASFGWAQRAVWQAASAGQLPDR